MGHLGSVLPEKPRQFEQTRHCTGIVVRTGLVAADVVVRADHQDRRVGGAVVSQEVPELPATEPEQLRLHRQPALLEGRPHPLRGTVEIMRPLVTPKAGQPRQRLDIGPQAGRIR